MNYIRKEVRSIDGYHVSVHDHSVKLNQNESPYDIPEKLKQQALARIAQIPWNRYPSPYADALREKIAAHTGWTSEGVIVTAGSNLLIQAIVISSAVKGKVLTVTPSFSLYAIEGEILGNRVIEVPLDPEDFSLPTKKFLVALKKHKPNLVIFSNPNAPTGNVFPQADLLQVLEAAKKQGTLVVIDEAYVHFSQESMFHYLWRFPNLVLIRTLSKAFSLGGVRLGYLLADPKIVSEFLKVVLPFTVSSYAQAVGEIVLENDAYVSELVKEIVAEREIVYQILKQIKGIRVFPSKANFLLFQSKKSKQIFQRLLLEGVLIRDVSSKKLPNTLRVSIGSHEENKEFLEVMKRILN